MKILQIIPAPNWFAVYKGEFIEDEQPLVCWALIDTAPEGVGEEIRGMTAEGKLVDFADMPINFDRYLRQITYGSCNYEP